MHRNRTEIGGVIHTVVSVNSVQFVFVRVPNSCQPDLALINSQATSQAGDLAYTPSRWESFSSSAIVRLPGATPSASFNRLRQRLKVRTASARLP